jgi:hypothetical protein
LRVALCPRTSNGLRLPLAVRGAQALREDAERRKKRLGELAHLSTRAEPPWDRDVLARIDDLTGS